MRCALVFAALAVIVAGCSREPAERQAPQPERPIVPALKQSKPAAAPAPAKAPTKAELVERFTAAEKAGDHQAVFNAGMALRAHYPDARETIERAEAISSAALAVNEARQPRRRSSSARAYTPAQLREMIRAGRYPDQGAVSRESRSMPFEACAAMAESVVGAVGGQYPAQRIVDTSILKIYKVWANDGATTVQCDRGAETMVTTIAPYR